MRPMTPTPERAVTPMEDRMMPDLPDDLQGWFDAGNPETPRPGPNRSAVYRHCFEVRRREMEGRNWTAAEARARAIAAYEVDMQPVPADLVKEGHHDA